MSLPPFPQFGDDYDGSKLRYMVQVLENNLQDLSGVQALSNLAAINKSFITPQGNVGSSETTIFSSVVAPTRIYKPGWYIKLRVFGGFAGNNNVKRLKLLLNSTVLFDSTALVVNDGNWVIDATIVMTSVTTQQNIVTTACDNNAFPSSVFYTSTAVNVAPSVTIGVTATGVADDDIIGQVMLQTLQPN